MAFFKKVKNCITLMLALLIVISCSAFKLAYAEESGIMSELATMSIDGKPFNVSDYPADSEAAPQILNLYEGGYSETGEQERYGLLLYIYNPSQIDLTDDKRNTVQMITGNAERSEKYNLKLLETSADKLFAKFQVDFTAEQKTYVLSTLSKDSRKYDINTIELYISGANATSFPIEKAFKYSGFEGTDTLTGTLNYTVEGGTETIPLSVKHTTWRPEGTNGKSEYTQDSLHSVYFAVPKEFTSKYDYLNSVHVEWLQALTNPILVTGNAELSEALDKLIKMQRGTIVDTGEIFLGGTQQDVIAPKTFDYTDFDWHLVETPKTSYLGAPTEIFFGNDKWFHTYDTSTAIGGGYVDNQVRKRLNSLYLKKLVTDGIFDIVSTEVEQLIETTASNLQFVNDKEIADKYPSYLFEMWANEKTDKVIPVGENYSLTSEKVESNLWEKLWGWNHVEDKKPFDIKAIKEVEAITGNQATDCANFYISPNDYPEFEEFYKANKDSSTIYLLRFAQSEYYSVKVEEHKDVAGFPSKKSDGYIAQTWVFLDFDVIDLEYVKKGKSYVIPVDMSPIDIFPELTPPPNFQENDFWKYGCAMIAGLIAFYTVYKVANKEITKRT